MNSRLAMSARRAAGLVVAVALLGGAAPAYAEGNFNTSVTDVMGGFESRRWADRNNDSANTTVTFDGCRYKLHGNPVSGDNVELELWRVIDHWPDDTRGRKKLACNQSGTGNWGRQSTSGTYYFDIFEVDGASSVKTVSANPVKVKY